MKLTLKSVLGLYMAVTIALGISMSVYGTQSPVTALLFFAIALPAIYVLREMGTMELKIQGQDTVIAAQKDTINGAYYERNMHVALLARLYPSGIRETHIEGWDEEWRNCVYIDLPAGQISYHYHTREAHLFHDLPPYTKPWDGHQKDLVHERLLSPGTFTGVVPTAWLDNWLAERALYLLKPNHLEHEASDGQRTVLDDLHKAANEYLGMRVFTKRYPENDWTSAAQEKKAELSGMGFPLQD